MALNIGDKAPDFSLSAASGKTFSLSQDMAGKACIIYFYPKNFTPGCTKEACEFRNEFEEFQQFDVQVIGISRDSIDSHQKFQQQYQLPFELLSDPDGQVCKRYDALIPVIGVPKRVTYLLDKSHRIAAVYDKMFDAQGHISSMIARLTLA